MKESILNPYEEFSLRYLVSALHRRSDMYHNSHIKGWSGYDLYYNVGHETLKREGICDNQVATAVFREVAKFNLGQYRECHRMFERYPHLYIPLHFLHWSSTERGKVAYTQKVRDLVQDRQIKTTIGRYLTANFSHLYKPHEIAQIANELITEEFGNDKDFKMCRTREDIARAFESGPESCMGKHRRNFDTSDIHPTEVYATEDIGVAILEDEDSRIYARTVCNLEKKLFGRVYGNETALTSVLVAKGFTKHCSPLTGCRILAIYEDGGGYVGPYIDGGDDIFEGPDGYLVIDDSDYGDRVGSCSASHETRGFISKKDAEYYCDHCDEDCDDIAFTSPDTGDVGYCCRDYYVFVESHDEYYLQGTCSYVDDRWERDEDLSYSNTLERYILDSSSTPIITPGGSTDYVPEEHSELIECAVSQVTTLSRWTETYVGPNKVTGEVLISECADRVVWSNYYFAYVDAETAVQHAGDYFYPEDIPANEEQAA